MNLPPKTNVKKSTVVNKKKKKDPLPAVTLDDIFGKQGKLGVPIINIGSAYNSPDVFGDVIPGYENAKEYTVFSFDSELNVDSSRSNSVSSTSTTASSINENKSRKTESSKPRTGWFGTTNRSTMGNNQNSANNAPHVPASKSSFEAVFANKEEEFEVESPFQQDLKENVKKAATEVFMGTSQTVEEKARQLFLLDQLQKPAPPVIPPKLGEVQVSTALKARRTQVKRRSKRGTAYRYDPSATALGIKGGNSGFASLVEIMTKKTSLNLGWKIRVEICLDVAFQLKKLHALNKTHNSLDKDGSILIALDTFRAAITDEKNTVATFNGSPDQPEGKGRMMRDVLYLGIVILYTATRSQNGVDGQDWVKFKELISIEKSASSKKNFEELDDKLYNFQEGADREVREALAKVKAPGSLLELCAQCCSGDRSTRPNSMDAWDWLDSILNDMEKANTGSPSKAEDQPELISIEAKKIKDLHVIKNPKLADVVTLDNQSDNDDYESGVTSDGSGYMSDDSYQPPANEADKKLDALDLKMKEAEDKRKSKLLEFLNTTTTNNNVTKTMEKGMTRPMSMQVTSSSNNGKNLTDFSQEIKNDAPLIIGAVEAQKTELTRRRSLDRGYMWAKQKFAPDSPSQMDSPKKAPARKVVADSNVGQFKEAWKVAQTSTKARSSDELAKIFSNQERLSQEEALAIIKKAETIMRKEPNLVNVYPPVNVVGDIHGQFFDLINMMNNKCVKPGKGAKQASFVFLGDYVDRGDFSCEVLLYLLALKSEYPDSVYLLRGNHECKTVSSYFGFKEEADNKYGLTVYTRCLSVFQAMPMAALIETQAGRFLCCHGGISPNITSLEQFVEYNRFIEPGMNGFLCDLLWSDPIKDAHEDGTEMSLGDFLSIDYLPNPARGCSYRYGFKALVSFLAINKLVAIIRAHEVMQNGYKYHFQELTGGKAKTAAHVMPPVITVFSAPNYCERYGNRGAFLRVHQHPPSLKPDKNKKKILKNLGYKPLELLEPVQFTEVPHPAPMQVRNKTMEQESQIVNSCPYMPTTFHAFLKRATDLAEKDQDVQAAARARARASRAIAPINLPPKKTEDSSAELKLGNNEDDDDESTIVQISHKSLGQKVLRSIASLPKIIAGIEPEPTQEEIKEKADKAAKKNWKALQQLGLDKPPEIPKGEKFIPKAERLLNEKFESAAENDGVNEMNPYLLEQKVLIAKQKLEEKKLGMADETELTINIAVTTNTELNTTPKHKSLGAKVQTTAALGEKKSSKKRNSLGATTMSNRSSQKLKVGDGLFRIDSKLKNTLSDQQEIPLTEEETVMTFTKKELLSLQMLFLLIDRQDKGLIDVDDLVAWSAEAGYAVPQEEAEICVRYVDADADGKIGFEDYLAFAARSKDLWLVQEYSSVITAVKTLQNQNAEDELDN